MLLRSQHLYSAQSLRNLFSHAVISTQTQRELLFIRAVLSPDEQL